MERDDFEAKRDEELAAMADGTWDRPFYQLIYNERCAPATEWFGSRGWSAIGTPLGDFLRDNGRPVPAPDTEAGPMFSRNVMVTAVKA
jgi:hypothetical protein